MSNATGPLVIYTPRQMELDSISVEALLRHDLTGGLSIDELVQHCADKLRDTDKRIRSMMSEQNSSAADQKALARLETVLNRYRNDMADPENKDGANNAGLAAVKQAYEEAERSVSDPALKQAIAAKKNEFNATAGDGCVSKAEMEAFVSSAQDELDGIKSGDQMRMLKLQSLVEERGRTLSMFSNMIAKLEESSKGIIQNMAR